MSEQELVVRLSDSEPTRPRIVRTIVRDPDGNIIEIVEELQEPVARPVWDTRMLLAIHEAGHVVACDSIGLEVTGIGLSDDRYHVDVNLADVEDYEGLKATVAGDVAVALARELDPREFQAIGLRILKFSEDPEVTDFGSLVKKHGHNDSVKALWLAERVVGSDWDAVKAITAQAVDEIAGVLRERWDLVLEQAFEIDRAKRDLDRQREIKLAQRIDEHRKAGGGVVSRNPDGSFSTEAKSGMVRFSR